MTMLSGERKTISTPTLVLLDDPSVFNCHHPSVLLDYGVELSYVMKSAKAWALIAVLGLKRILYSLSSTTYFNSRPDKFGFCNVVFIKYVVRTVIWCP